ncbi:MAE_28990/MAE_18760 family HEPN-like nuclease [Streptomyces coelicoflavus]|uniref:MAE_28990/MAE_18760 family HEPN-like nuclease n=1 Tax=Streptomyces coelicoflavus TaxID=285562 RepID=UPI003A860687
MRTPGEIEDALNQDLAWRRTELHSMLAQIRVASGPALNCLCRAGVALLYAHWEGYSKKALSDYLRYVARRKLKASELVDCFVAMAFEAKIAKEQDMSRTRRSIYRITLLREDSRPHIPSGDGVDTQSNLNSDLCFEIMHSLGLDPSAFETKRMLMDYSLLAARNKIAHGEYIDINPEDYETLHYEVISMIETMRNIIMDAVDNRKYRKQIALASD